MRRTLACLFINFGILSLYAQEDIQAGTIHFSAKEVNFGIIERDSDPFREITITNLGNYPLIINSCRASCGCTVPNCPVEAIAPKKKSTIKIRYNTHNIGSFSKTITVYSNDQKNPISLIRIYGEVKDNTTAKQKSTP